MARLIGLLLLGGYCLMIPAKGWPQSPPQPSPQIIIAVFQQLDESKQLAPLLQSLIQAYEDQTGQTAVSLDNIKQILGHYGPKLLGDCQAKVACLTQKIRTPFPTVPYGLFLGVGGLGDTLLLNMVLIDLKTGTELKQGNHTFTRTQDIKTKLPDVMKELFPNYGKIRYLGLPPRAILTIQGKVFRSPKQWNPVPANQDVQILVTAPGHQSTKQTLQVKPGERREQTLRLLSLTIPPRRVVGQPPIPRIPDTPSTPPITQRWWFWTIVGVVVVGAGVGVTVGVLSNQKQRKEGEFVAIEVPPFQP